MISAVYFFLVVLFGALTGLSLLYLTLLLAAAIYARRKGENSSPVSVPAPMRVEILIPAHNEQPVIAATLKSLQEQTFSLGRFEVVVIADNCTDQTAEIAREFGATVLERHDPEHRGKGYALNYAITRRLQQSPPADAFVIVDADTRVIPDFLNEIIAKLVEQTDQAGCGAVQGRYGVLNPNDGWRAALMSAALDLVNHVRPMGVNQLGLSVGLKGNGMAFTREILAKVPWSASITEDIDFGLDLLLHHGVRVGYAPEARVLAQMPVNGKQAASQRSRWEGGRFKLMRERAPGLLLVSLRKRDLRLAEAAVSLVVPPLVELAALMLGWELAIVVGDRAGLLPYLPFWYGAIIVCSVAFAAYVLLGMQLAGAPRAAYRGLLAAPVYALWKLALYPRTWLLGRKSSEWVRTERIAIGSDH